MPELIPVLTQAEIKDKVIALAAEISNDYRGCEADLVLVGVLKGAFLFLADLIREISIPVKVDFVQCASYNGTMSSSENIRLIKPLGIDIRDAHLLVVEDIIDTGLTFQYLLKYLASFGPKSIKTCALIDKHERRMQSLIIDYAGHVVEKGFLIGYGLDYAERYRHLPGIYHLKLKPGETA